jgi:uncharacterized membrane protein YozB (DUF420 family)
MDLSVFPPLNATLNATSTVLLLIGYALIKTGRKTAHRNVMLAACATSTLFLAGYLYYHAHHGVTRFAGQGWVRQTYFTVLTTHTILAIAVPPLVIMTLLFAARADWPRHRRWARVTFPIWLYVSFTGVVIYWMLYRL